MYWRRSALKKWLVLGFETQGPNFVTQIHKQLGGRSSVGVFSFSFAFCVLAPQDGLEVEVEVTHFFVIFFTSKRPQRKSCDTYV